MCYMIQLLLMINILALNTKLFGGGGISKFRKYLKNDSLHNIYYSGTQKAFNEFQGLINSYFDKSFQKQTFTITYKNRYPWMTNSLHQKIAEKISWA